MAVNADLLLLIRTMYCAPVLRESGIPHNASGLGKGKWAGVGGVYGGNSVANGTISVTREFSLRRTIGLLQSIADRAIFRKFVSNG